VSITTVELSFLGESPDVFIAIKVATGMDIAFSSVKRLSATTAPTCHARPHSFRHIYGERHFGNRMNLVASRTFEHRGCRMSVRGSGRKGVAARRSFANKSVRSDGIWLDLLWARARIKRLEGFPLQL
jgi:hypothetical protein